MNTSHSSLQNISDNSDLLYESVQEVSDLTYPQLKSDLSDISRLIEATQQQPIGSIDFGENQLMRQDNKGKTMVERVEPIDDFIRNFFIKNGLTKSLTVFQQEFYELKTKHKGQRFGYDQLPDIYLQNQKLEQQVSELQKEIDAAKLFVNRTKETFEKLRKERDHNKLHYSRVQHEKEKLIKEVEKLKSLQLHQEQLFQEITCKYESCMKDKMLIKLEKDRLSAKIESLQKISESYEKKINDFEGKSFHGFTDGLKSGSAHFNSNSKITGEEKDKENRSFNTMTKKKSTNKGTGDQESFGKNASKNKENPQFTLIPPSLINPQTGLELEPIFKRQLAPMRTFKGHMSSISRCKIHPKKPFLATASDDKTWKVWSLPKGELIMSGEGHTDWISDIAFHPRGTHLATSSGDCTVKVWDLANVSCAYTFKEHAQPVWSLSFHHSGDFLVAGAMDHCCRMYDIPYGKVRYNFRGHVDSVNYVKFSNYGNWFVSGSTDKTISMWDIRTGLLTNTLYGHVGGINSLSFSADETKLVSVDTEGVVKCWDVRAWKQIGEVSCGSFPLNGVDMDPSGKIAIVGSDDSNIKIIDLESMRIDSELKGHEDAVLDVAMDVINKELITCSADCTFRTWT